MQKIKPLLDQASKATRKGKNSRSDSSASSTEAGRTSPAQQRDDERVAEPESGYGQQSAMDHVDAINQIFAEFEFAYHNQFHKAFADAQSLAIAKKYWLSCLENYRPNQIVQAARSVVRQSEYLPSIAVILQACEKGYDLFGLPTPRAAYVEACQATSPKRDYNWSHPAVYLAGLAVGWFDLASESEASMLPRFTYHYEQLCHQVMNGEELRLQAHEPLPDKIERPLDRKEAQARIAKMRSKLGL